MRRLLTSIAIIMFSGAAYAGEATEAKNDSELGYAGASVMTGGTDNGQNLNEVEEELDKTNSELGHGGASVITGGGANEDDVRVGDTRGDTDHPEGEAGLGADNS